MPHIKKAARALHRTAFWDDCRFSGSAVPQSIAEARNGCMPAQYYCGGPARREEMVLPIAGG
jgi:hypothetical protein